MIEELNIIRFWKSGQQKAWLVEMQPIPEDRVNWWLSIIEYATHVATSDDGKSVQDRRTWVQLALTALDGAQETHAIDNCEVAIRAAHMSAALSTYGNPEEFHSSLTSDNIAKNCLLCIDMSYGEAATKTAGWQAQPIEVIRSLRKIKNITNSLVFIVDGIADSQTRQSVQRWINLLPGLP